MNSKVNPRKLAVKALCRVESDNAYSNIALNSLLKEYELSKEDKALCTSLFYGVLDRKITLDYVLKNFISSGFNKIKPFTLNVLRTAVYQIMYMDKIPDSAAVNEAVKIIKNSKESYASGFINGVLRNILRSEISIPTGDSSFDLSVKYSVPEWIVDSFIKDYTLDATKKYLEATLLTPPTYIRVNTEKISKSEFLTLLEKENIKIEETSVENALSISGYSSIEALDLYKNGYFFVQDIACQMAIESLNIEENDRVFDMCSAPGGKAFSASLSAENVQVLAADLYEQRVKLISTGASRLGLSNIDAIVANATVYNSELGTFDKIICDVPCSGLGVLRRKPDIKYRVEDDFDELCNIQMSILENADKYLKVNGKILYSTCTLRRAENEDIVNAFLKQHRNYRLISSKTYFPHIDGSDGFYSAVLEKI